MKEINIKIKVIKGKIAYAIQTEGYERNDISNQLELLGLLETTTDIIKERINTLLNVSK